ncbi:MAG: DUF4406 domain-containing protein [Armatimonadota bacterium]|nr:DUF4406 domain-containing protein [Armatimonadota bacterium]
MTLYLSGPMTGLPEANYPAFEKEAARLRSLGYAVVSPHELDPGVDASWLSYMRVGVAALAGCDAIALLDGWERSRGAKIEESLASALGLAVYNARNLT